ncbi:MAG: HPr family phosphocarrier protein [Planctomycetota bacterium]
MGDNEQPSAQRSATVRNADGLHARPAEMVAREAMRFESDIRIVREDYRIDAKSILDVLTLGAAEGTELTITAKGVDAEAAAEAVGRLVESDFEIDSNKAS